MQPIYLIGFMGSGKTTIGKKIAARLHLPFIDLDERIEQYAGKKIPSIFAEDGEKSFRMLEEQILCQSGNTEAVFATGGGIILNEKNRSFLKKQRDVIYLEKAEESLLQHLNSDQQNIRPLIVGKSPEEIIKIYCLRKPLYQESAAFTITIQEESPDEAAEKIISRLKGVNHG